jgi:hypothetical protein
MENVICLFTPESFCEELFSFSDKYQVFDNDFWVHDGGSGEVNHLVIGPATSSIRYGFYTIHCEVAHLAVSYYCLNLTTNNKYGSGIELLIAEGDGEQLLHPGRLSHYSRSQNSPKFSLFTLTAPWLLPGMPQ